MLKKLFKLKKIQNSKDGFTIVEFLIATAVFGTVMIILVLGVISITNEFYKGINYATTQDASRNIMSSLAQEVQFQDSVEASPSVWADQTVDSQFFCLGPDQINYLIGYEEESTPNVNDPYQSSNVLILNHDDESGCPTTPPTPSGSPSPDTIYCQQAITSTTSTGCGVTGTELMPQNMRLSNLSVQSLGNNLWKLDIRVVYGGDNVLCSPTNYDGYVNDCSFTGTSGYLTAPNLTCKPGYGDQYCATSELTTIIQERVS